MTHKKHLALDGPFAGLWVRTARALLRGGYKSREEVSAALKTCELRPSVSVPDYGRIADIEVMIWLLEHGDMTGQETLERITYVFGSEAKYPR